MAARFSGVDGVCLVCGGRVGEVYHVVDFFALPWQLVQPRHHAAERMGVLCHQCYERDPHVTILIDRQPYRLSLGPRQGVGSCLVCRRTFDHHRLHGIIVMAEYMGQSCLGSSMLAELCGRCLEKCCVELPHAP